MHKHKFSLLQDNATKQKLNSGMSLGYGKGQEDVFLLLWFLSPTWIWLHLRMGLFFLAVRRISVCLTVTFPVILFLSPCKQPLKAWCTLRNNLRQSILTSHWKTINCLSYLSFIQSKVRSDSECLNYTRQL